MGSRSSRARRMLLAGSLAVACACAGGARDDRMLAVVRRFVDTQPTPLTAQLPAATILDVTRFALAAPRELTIVWPKFLPPHEGARIVTLRPLLPPEFETAPRLLVFAERPGVAADRRFDCERVLAKAVALRPLA